MSKGIDTIIFDLGGVLIDWNPRYLYRKMFDNDETIEWFLSNICTSEWNDALDAGRSFSEAVEELAKRHPEYDEAIRAWSDRWPEMISGPISGTVDILREIKERGEYRLYALTNWSAETFPWALKQFEFLKWFEGIVVSGTERTRKPHPEFFRILFDRYQVNPSTTLFIDDNVANIKGGEELGLHTITFENPEQLRIQLRSTNVIE
jgi:2-haloacid dehalogenase